MAMTDLTPLRELLAKWEAESNAAYAEERWAVVDTYDACDRDVQDAIAAIESANPWIPVEKGLPEPSSVSGMTWDIWYASTGLCVRACQLRANHARGTVEWRVKGIPCPIPTHYRRHVPEKGPSE